MRLRAPRTLKDPVFWNSSALSETPRALEPKVGVRWIRPASTARACSTSSRETLIGRPLPNERVEGAWGNREVPPHKTKEGGNVGETWFPPRERAGGERRSRRKCLARGDLRHAEAHGEDGERAWAALDVDLAAHGEGQLLDDR